MKKNKKAGNCFIVLLAALISFRLALAYRPQCSDHHPCDDWKIWDHILLLNGLCVHC